jgi:porin
MSNRMSIFQTLSHRRIACMLAVAGLLLASTSSSRAEEEASLWPTPHYEGGLTEREALLGDLDGSRTRQAERGIVLAVDWTQTLQGVVDGGRETGAAWGGSVDAELRLDFQKMGLWPGGFLHMLLEWQHGEHVLYESGSLLAVNTDALFPLPGQDEAALSDLTFIQFLHPRFGVALGKLTTLDGDANELAQGRGKRQFLHQNLVLNPVTLLTIPYSALGVTLIALPWDDAVASFAVLDSEGQADQDGFDTLFKDGTSLAFEFRTRIELAGLEGHQLIGATWSDKRRAELDQRILLPILGAPIEKTGDSWSAYYNFDQNLWQSDAEASRKVGVFGRLGFSDGNPNPIEFFASVGLGGTGLFGCRPDDSWGIGYHYTKVSDDLPDLPLDILNDDGHGGELFYNIAVTPWLHVTPDVQVLAPTLNKQRSGRLRLEEIDSPSVIVGLRVVTDI